MAIKLLNGTNWVAAGDWSPANAPITGDDARVSDAPRDTITGDQGGVDLHSLLVPGRFVGSFGTSGAPLKISCGNGTNPKVVYKGRGGFFYESDKNGASNFRTPNMEIDAADSAVKVEIGSNGADPGFVDRIHLARCNALIKGNIAFDTGSLVEVMREASLMIASGITNALPVLHNQGAVVKCESVITTMRMIAGEHTQDVAKITNADVFAGVLVYNHAAVGGDATVIRVWDGATLVLDANSNAKTITTVHLYPGAKMIPSKPDGINIIITNLFDLRR